MLGKNLQPHEIRHQMTKNHDLPNLKTNSISDLTNLHTNMSSNQVQQTTLAPHIRPRKPNTNKKVTKVTLQQLRNNTPQTKSKPKLGIRLEPDIFHLES
jgi:hypothetical protein